MRIVFMGTMAFAVPTLSALHEAGEDVALVVTQPDRVRARGKKVLPTPVKTYAETAGLSIAQPERIKGNDEFVAELKELAPDIILVAAYGKILPPEILNLPRLGSLNLHASILPHYRGAAPIHRAVEAGETVTGITLMYMSEGMDEGDIALIKEVPIEGAATGALTERLAGVAAELMIEALPLIKDGGLPREAQDDSAATYAPPVSKEEGHLDFSLSAEALERRVRAMTPTPGAFVLQGETRIKVLAAELCGSGDSAHATGALLSVSPEGIEVMTGSGTLLITEIAPAGKRAMTVSEYLRGNEINKEIPFS